MPVWLWQCCEPKYNRHSNGHVQKGCMFTQACQTLNMDTFLKRPCERQDHSLRAPLSFSFTFPCSALRLPRSRSPRHSRGNALESDAYRASATRGKAAALAAHTSALPKALNPNALLTGTQTSQSTHGRGDPTARVGNGKRRWRSHGSGANCRLRPRS